MYDSGIPVVRSSTLQNPPVEPNTHEEVVAKKTAIVSPEKKPLFTMDMFKPREESTDADSTNVYEESDDDLSDEFQDLEYWSSDSSGNSPKTPPVEKAIEKVITDYKKLSAESKHSNDDVSSDARSERVARRSETLKKLMDFEYEESRKSDMKMKMKKSSQRSSQSIM
jgi:hypothetical protein